MKTRLFVVLAVVLSILIVGSIALAQETKKDSSPKAETKKGEKTELKKIDVNSATQEELESLPGIGPKLAQAIIDGRPYEKVEDLLKVKGIGEKKLAKIKDLIEVKPIAKKQKEKKKSEEKSKKKEEKKTETKPKK